MSIDDTLEFLRHRALALAAAGIERDAIIAALGVENAVMVPSATAEQLAQLADEALDADNPERAHADGMRDQFLRMFEAELKLPPDHLIAIEQEGSDDDAAWYWRVRHRRGARELRVGPFSSAQVMKFETVRVALGAQADLGAKVIVGRDPLTAYWDHVQLVKTVLASDPEHWSWLLTELSDFASDLRHVPHKGRDRPAYDTSWDWPADEADQGEGAATFVRRHFNETYEHSIREVPGNPADATRKAFARLPTRFIAERRLHVNEGALYRFAFERFKASGQGQGIKRDRIKRGLRALGFEVPKDAGLRVAIDPRNGKPRKDRWWAVSPVDFDPGE